VLPVPASRRARLLLCFGALLVYGALAILAMMGAPDGRRTVVAALALAGGLLQPAIMVLLTRADASFHENAVMQASLDDAHRRLREMAGLGQELAIVKERSRVAAEMQDSLGNRLLATATQLEDAQCLLESDPARASQRIGDAREQVRHALSDLGRGLSASRSPQDVDLSLPIALSRLAHGFEAASGIATSLTAPADLPPLCSAHRGALYRAAQEMLSLVQRHGEAREVSLELVRQGSWIRLLMCADGPALLPVQEEPGTGVRALRDRAVQLGGEFCLEPRPGGGNQAWFAIPAAVEAGDG
jgi:signal transduction histidine kinase